MLGIIKDGRFKEADNKKILSFINSAGKKVSIINPKEIHFKQAGYKEVIFLNTPLEITEGQYRDIVYSDKTEHIEAEYIIKNINE